MPPPPVRDDHDAFKRMRSLAARLRALDCPAHLIPADLLAEGDLLRSYLRRRVARVTADVDQDAAATLDALNATAAG